MSSSQVLPSRRPELLCHAQVWVVYASMALIIAIIGIITVRGILALASWAAIGRTLWLFPHLLSEVQREHCAQELSVLDSRALLPGF